MSESHTSPDQAEIDHAAELDDVIPTRGYQMTPVVGIGASAGGLAPILEFFRNVKPDSGVVYVVVMHLSPSHESTLVPLIARATAMPVHQAGDGQATQPNNVYVIPPGQFLSSVDGRLRLQPVAVLRGRRDTIDLFFRTLADTHGPHAIVVVLSGADSDGAIGVKRIKERGGLTIVQDPNEAEHAGMPRSAIATGMADWVLKVAEMPGRIGEFLANERRVKVPREDVPAVPLAARSEDETSLREILVFLRTRTGRDFTAHKRATVLRRIARRMQVNSVDDLPAYVAYLHTHPGEAGALLHDLLISVTNFFRDRDAFDALTGFIPTLFANKGPGESVRVWVPACATGEEAYSIAMLLVEHADTLDHPPALQVFACDLNEDAIRTARLARYPDTIATDVSEERLRRFFTHEGVGYQVRRELREMVLFATHDMLKDAPFSRMDLISCRNFLIYLGREAQLRVLDIFHFALRPGGKLFLGTSEAVDEASPLFKPLDKKYRIYVQQPAARTGIAVPLESPMLRRPHEARQDTPASAALVAPPAAHPSHDAARTDVAELHFKLLEQFAPPSVLVNAEHDIVHLSEHAGRFLKLAGGEPSLNLPRDVDPTMSPHVRAALFRANEIGAPVQTAPIVVDVDGKKQSVSIRVAPAPEIGAGYSLVVFDARPGESEAPEPAPAPVDTVVRSLERELQRVKVDLRETVEEYEASGEELKASNEELQAMNEELRSATEELETSREELQSINEELTTVNQDLKAKMDELATANSDLQNLMASTAIATVFLDRKLTIKRYTPPAAEIFNLIPGDVGRPLAHLKHRLTYPDLIRDAEQVRETLVPIERDVTDGTRSFLSRLQPYRTLEDHIGGIVLTLVDVTERNRAVEALRRSEERIRLVIESARDYAIFTIGADRRIDSWNSGAQSVFGYAERDIVGHLHEELFRPEDRAAGVPEREMNDARDHGRAVAEAWYPRKDGSLFFGTGSTMPIRDGDTLVGWVKIIRDITASKRADDARLEHIDDVTRFNAAAVGRETRMIELKKEVNELASRLGEPVRYSIPEE